jgi:CubicO group peptidase (beta-lactamase class C family)
MRLALMLLAVALTGCSSEPGPKGDSRPSVPQDASARSAVQLPETPAGKKLDAWVAAINAGTRPRIDALHAGDRDAERMVAKDVELADWTGGLDIYALERSTPTEIAAIARARTPETWLRIEMTVEPVPPHAIAHFWVRPLPPPPDAVGKDQLPDAEIVKRLEAFVDKLVKAGRFSGTVLVARDGRTLYEKAAGLASRAWNAPVRIDTKLNLGSMNKMFTATAIGQLVDKGKIKLDDKVGKYLPDFPNADVRDKVTVAHLLSHSSGLGSFFGDKFDERKLKIREVRDYLPLIAEEKLAFEPGSKWAYSNSGFILLGAIVEAASGENYFDYIRKHVYETAGMRDSDCYDVDRDVPNLASGYTRSPDGWRTNIFLHVVRGGPAGGGYSTVPDLLRFALALRGDKLMSPATTSTFVTGKMDTPGGGKYAFGFGDRNVRGHRIVGHSGGFPGISSDLDIYWDDGYVVAVMSNVDMGSMPVVEKARELIAR